MQKIDPEFISLSRRIGENPLFIQGAGGNTSLKTGTDRMWVKASGKWLAQAEAGEVFVPVNRTRINEQIRAGIEDPLSGASYSDDVLGLRPSIETTLHSLMPHAVVFHTHSINTIVHSVQKNAENILAEKLKGFDWAFVPYSKPGLPLTRLVSGVLSKRTCNILVIQNHGLVVGSETVQETLALMLELEARLMTTARPVKKACFPTLNQLCSGTGFVAAECNLTHQLALDPHGFEYARMGSLYPDHVVFLGKSIAAVDTKDELNAFFETSSEDPLWPKAVALRSVGVFHDKSLSAGGHEMLRALANTVIRLPLSASLNYLTAEEERELVDWDAEKYRQALTGL
ncbi:class II aldolase/adducin family protein [Labrenzia sp. PHM005]|uniref:class II aldolase/adducin family protein n=1 Tax=Labrenzia sp. PHM005 TaxID=2590016 RepID=UPI00114026F3|nr:class II aldolase/adducin family protein [Labrenzia sp. PHM005]QDG78170.1 class II aldolase [Labrenzia sp. PHM005]